MGQNQILLTIALCSLILFLLKSLIKTEESFAVPNTDGTCPDKNWWDTMTVKTIISKSSGVNFAVDAIDPSQSIKSPILVPIHQQGTTNATSCLYVNDDGTYSTSMCDKEISRQQWLVKIVTSEDEFKAILANKPKQPGDLKQGMDLSDITYGFCMIISKHRPYKALQYENNSLAVRDVGNYLGQKWDISPNATQAAITYRPYNPDSLFTPEKVGNGQINNYQKGFNPVMPMGANPSLSYQQSGQQSISNNNPSETAFGTSNAGFNISVNLDKKVLSEIMGDSDDNTDTIEAFQNVKKKKCKCNGCKPFDLGAYIKNAKIPCAGCNFDQ